MQIPLEVTFRNVEPSPAMKASVRRRVSQLEHFYGRLTGCHVTISAPHKHQHTGVQYSVHIRLLAPGKVIVVSHEHHPAAREDAYVALRDAFAAARRRLEDYARRRRGDVKTHRVRAAS